MTCQTIMDASLVACGLLFMIPLELHTSDTHDNVTRSSQGKQTHKKTLKHSNRNVCAEKCHV